METVIELRRCYRCGWISDVKYYESGDGCRSCGGRHLQPAHPTKINILKYFINHPSRLKIWILENVIKRNR